MSDGGLTSDRRLIAGIGLAFAAVAVLAAVDIASDVREGTTVGHVIVEAGVVGIGLLGASFVAGRLLRDVRRARASAVDLAAKLAASAAEAARWRGEAREVLAGLGAALERQFERWELSPAEKEVAMLLLKGLSHKEIADVRSVSEATARQQARAVYRKAGLSGRADLAAFFLEDLLLPDVPAPRPP